MSNAQSSVENTSQNYARRMNRMYWTKHQKGRNSIRSKFPHVKISMAMMTMISLASMKGAVFTNNLAFF